MVPLIACLFGGNPSKNRREFCRTPVVQQWWHADWFWISSPKDWRCQWTQDTNGGDGSLGYSPPDGCRYNVRPLEDGWLLLWDWAWHPKTNINLEMSLIVSLRLTKGCMKLMCIKPRFSIILLDYHQNGKLGQDRYRSLLLEKAGYDVWKDKAQHCGCPTSEMGKMRSSQWLWLAFGTSSFLTLILW